MDKSSAGPRYAKNQRNGIFLQNANNVVLSSSQTAWKVQWMECYGVLPTGMRLQIGNQYAKQDKARCVPVRTVFSIWKRFDVFSIILCLQKRIFHNVELSALKWQELSRWTKTLHGFWGSFSNKIIRKSVANTLQYLQPSNPISSSWLLSYQILQLWADKPFFLGWCIIVSSPTFVVRIRTWLWLCIWEIGRC